MVRAAHGADHPHSGLPKLIETMTQKTSGRFRSGTTSPSKSFYALVRPDAYDIVSSFGAMDLEV